MSEVILVATTTPDQQTAKQIADSLVARRLAACVQIEGPVLSVYRWQGAVETSDEWRCSVKTVRALFGAVETHIRSLHPYDEPEIVTTRIDQGSASYLQWLQEQLTDPGP